MNISALSWNIATEPKLYWQLAINPYTPRALEIISERFPGADRADIIRAVVLAEPEGKYDRNFKNFPESRQKILLNQEAIAIAGINSKLTEYSKVHRKAFNKLSDELIFRDLSKFAFASDDVKEIEIKYSQNQRRVFRSAIVNFIQTLRKPRAVSEWMTRFDITSAWRVQSSEQTFWKKPWTFGTRLFKANRSYEKIPGNILLISSFAAVSIIFILIAQKQILSITENQRPGQQQTLGIGTQKVDTIVPLHLIIPKININAKIEQVDVTPRGEMEVPSSTVNAGWFSRGPVPGESGSAVIAGHFDSNNGDAGVFNNLNKLKTGDIVYIEDSIGKTSTFVVRESRLYDPGFAEDVFRQSGKSSLNLITCDGVWDGNKKSFTKRLVVFTDIVN